MSPAEKTKLTSYLSSLDRNEKAKLMKQASALRNVQKRSKPKRTADPEDEDESPIFVRKAASLDEYLWRIVSSEPEANRPELSGKVATVVGVSKTQCTLRNGEKSFIASLKGAEPLGVAIGDQVSYEVLGESATIQSVLPRRTVLSRPDVQNSGKERVIAANIDKVVVVVSVVSPPLHPRLIDRYLVAIQRGGCAAVIVVNKVDLCSEAALQAELSALDPYKSLAIPVFECSANARTGISKLRHYLQGSVAAFVGHSGVGKSSLVNAFDERLNLSVGAVSEGYGRGTHTTTNSSLVDLGDLKVIDTPGIRSFGLWDLTAEDLPLYFPEFASVGRCKFRDCSHLHEPHCAVKSAVQARKISKARYETYVRIRDSLQM